MISRGTVLAGAAAGVLLAGPAFAKDADVVASRIDELFQTSGIVPGPENMMAKLRYSMTDRNHP